MDRDRPDELHTAVAPQSMHREQGPPMRLSCAHFLYDFRLEQGGVVRAILDVCEALVERGHSATVLTCDATDIPERWTRADHRSPQCVPLPAARLGVDCISRAGLQQARGVLSDADVVHLHTPWSIGNLQLARILRWLAKPYVVTIHGMLDDWSMAQRSLKKRLFLALAGRRFLESAAMVHFTAEQERAQAIRWIPAAAARTAVIPLVFELGPYDNLPGPELAREAFPPCGGDEPTVLFLSRLHHKKGVELLIDAAAVLHDRGRRFQLLIAGPGDDAYRATLAVRAESLGLAERVHFLGMVRDQLKLSLYQAADVFVLPTQQENFGFVLVEALACGTPVLTTKGTDIWEEIEQAGGVIVPREAGLLAETMGRLLDDDALREELGPRGRSYIYKWLSHDRVVGQYEELYSTVVRGRTIG